MAASEKDDAEQLSLLRSTHELNRLNAVRDIKTGQVNEEKHNLDALQNARAVSTFLEFEFQVARPEFISRDL